jgi:hypothetical protein
MAAAQPSKELAPPSVTLPANFRWFEALSHDCEDEETGHPVRGRRSNSSTDKPLNSRFANAL